MEIDTKHYFSAGTYAKQMSLPMGHTAVSHKHTYDHLSILASGKATVTVEGTNEAAVYTAPCAIDIKAGLHHAITALEDTVWFCIHATEETDINHIDEVLIQKQPSEGE